MILVCDYPCELFSNKFESSQLKFQESAQHWIILRFPRATGVQFWIQRCIGKVNIFIIMSEKKLIQIICLEGH